MLLTQDAVESLRRTIWCQVRTRNNIETRLRCTTVTAWEPISHMYPALWQIGRWEHTRLQSVGTLWGEVSRGYHVVPKQISALFDRQI